MAHDKTPVANVDYRRARSARPYARREYLGRVLWACAIPLFRLSPRLLHAWRRGLLRLFGARIGAHVQIDPSAKIFMPWMVEIGEGTSIGARVLMYSLGKISLGERVTVSHGAHLCAGTHEYRNVDMPLIRLPIRVEADCWICADAFIGPGCVVSRGSVVAARAVVVSDFPPWSVVAGNPARLKFKRQLADE